MVERVRLRHVESLAAGERDHVPVRVDARRLDARVAEQRQELAAAAADVEHGRRAGEEVDVGPLLLARLGGGRAHTALEREVVGDRVRPGLRGDRGGRAGRAALEPEQALLQLGEASSLGLEVAHGGVEVLRERVDELQRRVCQRTLARGDVLDGGANGAADEALPHAGRGRAPGRLLPGPLRLGAPRCAICAHGREL